MLSLTCTAHADESLKLVDRLVCLLLSVHLKKIRMSPSFAFISLQTLDDTRKLKAAVVSLYRRYVQEGKSPHTSKICLCDNARLTLSHTLRAGLGGSKSSEAASSGNDTTTAAAPVSSAGGGGASESALQQEYNRQREHLERNVEALKRNIDKDMKLFRADRARLCRESITLTEELNELRRCDHYNRWSTCSQILLAHV